MFAQLALGIFMFFRGFNHYLGKKPDKNKRNNKEIRNRELRLAFYKAIGKVQMSLGVLFVVMGQVEYHIDFEDMRLYIGIYVVLGGIHLARIHKHRRDYVYRDQSLR